MCWETIKLTLSTSWCSPGFFHVGLGLVHGSSILRSKGKTLNIPQFWTTSTFICCGLYSNCGHLYSTYSLSDISAGARQLSKTLNLHNCRLGETPWRRQTPGRDGKPTLIGCVRTFSGVMFQPCLDREKDLAGSSFHKRGRHSCSVHSLPQTSLIFLLISSKKETLPAG